MREYRYQVDRDGRIFHDGTEVIDPQVLAFFLGAMQRTPEGQYLVLCQGERNWFDTGDTPFVIQRVRVQLGDGPLASVDLCLAGDHREALEPASLEARGEHLYCRVTQGKFPARFGRTAIQQIGPFVFEADGGLELRLGGSRHPIPRVPAISD